MDNHPSSSSPSKKPNFTGPGCFIGIGIVALIGIVGAVAIFGVFGMKSRHVYSEAREGHSQAEAEITKHLYASQEVEGQGQTVIIERSKMDSYSPENFGDALTVEHFVAMAASENATSLAKKRFAEKANGLRVEWMLSVRDIKTTESPSEKVIGDFSLPYEFRSGNGSRGSSFSVRAEFPSESISRLITLQKGSWVKVAGNLKFTPDKSNIIFENAELVKEAAVPAEAPANP